MVTTAQIHNAYSEGYHAYSDPNDFNNPYSYEDDPVLALAWDEGFANAEYDACEDDVDYHDPVYDPYNYWCDWFK